MTCGMLATTQYPSTGAATPLLIAHGLFGSARNWNVIAKRLSDRGPLVTVDMRNHGDSPRVPSQSYRDMADDLARVIGTNAPMDVLGHSMGGKAAMVLALSAPERVRRLVVADIAPVAYSHTQSHLIHAMRGLDMDTITRRSEAGAALAASVPDEGVRSFLLQSLDVATKTWRLNLDVLEAEMPGIIGFPDVTGPFEGPVLFLTGATSDYVRPEHRTRIKTLFPKARFAKIPNAGHWLHAEQPRAFEAAVRAFLG
jgi:esterase